MAELAKKWIRALTVYFDRRMLVMILLGFASGFPYLLVFGTFNLWLKDAGVSLAAIGLFSLARAPYSLKWVWSPIVDNVKLPFFWRLGRRRGWAIFAQIGLFFSLLAMSMTNPALHPWHMAVFTFLTVLASATQDIVLDAYRIESFGRADQGAGAATFVLGYRIGTIFSGAGALFMAAILSWENVYKIMSCGAIVGMITVLCARKNEKEYYELENVKTKPAKSWKKRVEDFWAKAVCAPFKDFMKKKNWFLVLVFIFLYRMSDAYIAPMAYPFYDDMGFSKMEIASVVKICGLIATILGTLWGGIMVKRFGIFRSLLWCGILQGASNLVFVWQASVGHDVGVFMITISIENISGGMSTSAFVAYLSSLCNLNYTATQYALLSSFMCLARDMFAATSGFAANMMSWQMFFIVTSLLSVPALVILKYIANEEDNNFIKAKLCRAGKNK